VRPIDIRARLDQLHREWNALGVIGQDRHGAEYAQRYSSLAEEAIREAERWFGVAFDRFDQSQ